MVYADLLESRGEHAKAEMLRLQETFDPDLLDEKREKRLRVLVSEIEPEWRAQHARRAIDGCDQIRWSIQCPKKWESLASTTDAEVRLCGTCNREVFFCTTIEDVRLRGEARQCVAFDASLVRTDARLEYDAQQKLIMMGEVAAVPDFE